MSFWACGISINIDGSKVVWWSQPQACSSILRFALKAGSARLARKMDMFIDSKMAEFQDALEARYRYWYPCTYMCTCTYLLLFNFTFFFDNIDYSVCSISSRGDYSRAVSISFHACLGVDTI